MSLVPYQLVEIAMTSDGRFHSIYIGLPVNTEGGTWGKYPQGFDTLEETLEFSKKVIEHHMPQYKAMIANIENPQPESTEAVVEAAVASVEASQEEKSE